MAPVVVAQTEMCLNLVNMCSRRRKDAVPLQEKQEANPGCFASRRRVMSSTNTRRRFGSECFAALLGLLARVCEAYVLLLADNV